MRIKMILKPILFIFLSLLAVSGVAFADQNNSLIGELSEIDVFHPPGAEDNPYLYNEWHYFNVIDEEQNISIICTFKLNGAFNASEVLLGYYLDREDPDAFFGMYPMDAANYSSQTPDVKIANSTVKLTPQGYCVHIESDNGSRVFDGLFEPEVEPTTIFNASGCPVQGADINWLVASSRMKVNGELLVDGNRYVLENARGYHDHNWGYWSWGDDIGWDWGQVSQTKNSLNESDAGVYSMSLGNITDANHTRSVNSALNLWKNREIIASFTRDEIEINYPAHYSTNQDVPIQPGYEFIIPKESFSLPMKTNIVASSDSDYLNITFDLQYPVPLPVAVPIMDENGNILLQYRIIWEMIGIYQVNGVIDGKSVSYTSDGFMEYVAGMPVKPEPLVPSQPQ